MNDQHVTAVATIWQVIVLVLNAGLFGWYLYETNRLRKAAERQTEATFRPALIVTHENKIAGTPRIENIGAGPAMDVSWLLHDSDHKGNFPFVRHGTHEYVPCDERVLFHAAERSRPRDKNNPAVITCEYKSLSGRRYKSVTTGNLETMRFTTTFSD